MAIRIPKYQDDIYAPDTADTKVPRGNPDGSWDYITVYAMMSGTTDPPTFAPEYEGVLYLKYI